MNRKIRSARRNIPRQHDKVTWTRLKGGTFHPVALFGVLEVERPRALAEESRSREFRNPYWVEAVVTSMVIWTRVKGGASCGARLKSEFGVSYILGVGFVSRKHSRSPDL